MFGIDDNAGIFYENNFLKNMHDINNKLFDNTNYSNT
jgi:hypothetical protein